jgi:cytoskeletal protein CcmA (bactofilin family)
MAPNVYDASAKASTAPTERPTSESRVDADSHFNGLFQTKQNLRIEGVAEGEIQCDGTMTIADGARVKAKVTANNVTVAGELEGEALCRDVFQIMPSGKVEATVTAKRLIVNEGGFYNGEFHMIKEEVAPPDARPPAAGQTGPRQKPEQDASAVDPASLTLDERWAKMQAEQALAKGTDKPKP